MSSIPLSELIKSSLDSAQKWEKKHDAEYLVMNYSDAILAYIGLATTTKENGESAISYWVTEGVPTVLSRLALWQRQLFDEIDSGKRTSADIGGIYDYTLIAQLAWVLNLNEIGDMFLSHARRPELQDIEVGTAYWCEYSYGLEQVAKRRNYDAPISVSGKIEQYWYPYLRLMDALSKKQDVHQVLETIEVSLQKRKKDKKMVELDAFGTEGSPVHSVKWDFRAFSLVRTFSLRS